MGKIRPRFKEGDVIWTIWKNKAVPLTVCLALPIAFHTYMIKENVKDHQPVPQFVSEENAFGSKQEIIDQL